MLREWKNDFGVFALSIGVCNLVRKSLHHVLMFVRKMCWHKLQCTA